MIIREMTEAGNPAPEYKQIEFMVKVRLNSALKDEDETTEKTGEKSREKTSQKTSQITSQKKDQKKDQKTTKWPEKWPESGLEKTREKSREKTSLKTSQKTSQKNIDQKEGTGKNNSDTVNVGVNERKVIETILRDPLCTAEALTESLNITKRQVERIFAKLKKKGLIRRVGPDKGGHWEVIEQNEKGGE